MDRKKYSQKSDRKEYDTRKLKVRMKETNYMKGWSKWKEINTV